MKIPGKLPEQYFSARVNLSCVSITEAELFNIYKLSCFNWIFNGFNEIWAELL